MPMESLVQSVEESFDEKIDWFTQHFVLSEQEQRLPEVQNFSRSGLFREAVTCQVRVARFTKLNEFIALEFSLVPKVEYVFTAFRDNRVFYVWVVTDHFDEATREAIYEREKAVIDVFDMFEFDFYIIARMGRDVATLISEGIDLAYKRR